MKRLIFSILIAQFSVLLYGQKEDYNWFIGDFSGQGNLKKNLFQFNDNGLESIDTVSTEANFYITNSSISDDDGNLLFYTNGRKIYDASHQVIENGDSLGFSEFVWNHPALNNSLNIPQGALILKVPDKLKKYLVFHLREDTISSAIFPQDAIVINALMKSSIETSTIGNIQVARKNKIIINDTMFVGNLTACRHGNGRDWWIVASEGKSNCIYTMLLTPDTLQIMDTTCLGMEAMLFGDIGQGSFTSNGAMYIKGQGIEGIDIFYFDRCNGSLIHKESIPRDNFIESNPMAVLKYRGRIAVSPNSRYLYVATVDSLYQFDLNSSVVANTKKLVKGLE